MSSSEPNPDLAPRPRVPLVLYVIAVTTLLLPEEASFFIGDLRLTVARAIFIVIAPLVVWRSIEQVTQVYYRFVWSDFWVVLAVVWMLVSVWQTDGADRAIVGSGSLALDFAVPYLAARFLLREPAQVMTFCRFLTLLIAVAGLLASFDTLTSRFVTHDLFASLTGYIKGWRLDILMRNGFLRASGPFEHPILLGMISGIGLMLATAQPARVWLVMGTGIGLASSISAGPIGSAFLGLALLLYAKLTPGFEGRWRLLMVLASGLAVALFIISSHPFGMLISYLTFDQANAYFRLMTWQFAGDLVLSQPLLGIGLSMDWARPDWMPPTVDAFWLCCAMMFGIPGSVLIFLTVVGAMSRRVDIAAAHLAAQERRLGLVLSLVLIMLIYTGFTVHYWGATWILIGLLTGVRATLGAISACASNGWGIEEVDGMLRDGDAAA